MGDTEARMAAHIDILADDALEGRAPGTAGDETARRYIETHFAEIGLLPVFDGEWQQEFAAPLHGQSVQTANIAGLVRGTELPDEYIVLLAHHDAQGVCAPEEAADRICNGAVDNASGVAMLIEMARRLARTPAPRSVIFLATGAEEGGLFGGRHFADNPPVPLKKMVLALGLDTVAARGFAESVGVLGEGLTNMDPLISGIASARGRTLRTLEGAQAFYRRSDHLPFAEAGVPALIISGIMGAGEGNFLGGDYGRLRYHRPSDEADADIDYSGAIADLELIEQLIRLLNRDSPRPAWLESAIVPAADTP
jgi:Zn-dependent M28 family amino/carboxypeptidase